MKILKKNKIQLIFTIVLAQLVFITSCSEDDRYNAYDELQYTVPETNFGVSSVNGLDVTFTNNSTDAVSYEWDFGDDVTSTEANPTHTYEGAGTYTVTLTSVSDENFISTSELEFSFVEADFSFTADELVANFVNESTSGSSYSWDFGDGVGTSTAENPEYTFPDFDTYTVTLTVTDQYGNPSVTSQDVLIVNPGAGTFEAEILVGDFDRTIHGNIQNPWAVNPDNSSVYNFWENPALETVVQLLDGGSDKGSSSSTSNLTTDSLKFDRDSKRAYQPIKVELDVEYTLSAYVKNKSASTGDIVGTFYILGYEPEDENVILTDNLAAYEVVASDTGAWDLAEFTFTTASVFNFDQATVDVSADDICTSVDEEWVILYFVPDLTTAEEVNLDDVSIATKGFE